jgi:hypothetical protein
MFKYLLNQSVTIQASGEFGVVVARSDSLMGEPQYLLRYKSADGRATETWWTESALA